MIKSQTLSNTASGDQITTSAAPIDHAGAPCIAFELIYERYAQPMFAYFYRHLRHRQDAEDLTALTFAEALRSSSRYAEQGAFEAWLWSIARHKLRDAQRRRHETIALDQVAPRLVDTAPLPETRALHAEHVELLQQLLDELPDDQRQVLRLRYFGDWNFKEIAELLDRSVGAVKMLVQRALATLRSRYPQHEQARLDSETGVRRSGNDRRARDTAFRLLSSTVVSVVASMCRPVSLPRLLIPLQPAPVPVRVYARSVERRRH